MRVLSNLHVLPAPGPGEVLLRHEAVGLNFIDTYFRTGLYPARLPTGLGMEAAGVVLAACEPLAAALDATHGCGDYGAALRDARALMAAPTAH